MGIGRVELLLLAVTSAYTGSKSILTTLRIIQAITGIVTEMSALGKTPLALAVPH